MHMLHGIKQEIKGKRYFKMEYFSIFLKEMADQLTIKNVDEAKFLYREIIPVGRAENIKDSLSFLAEMQRVELLTKENITELYKLCEQLPRKDLIPILDVFTEKYLPANVDRKCPMESEGETTTSFGTTNGQKVSNGFSTSDGCDAKYVTNGNDGNSDETVGSVIICLPVNDKSSPGLHDKELRDSLANQLCIDNNKPEEYAMKKQVHGQCMIFNNRFDVRVKLANGQVLKERNGTEKDVKSLTETFTWLGFVVSVCENKSAEDIIEILTMIASQDDQAEYECFVCCVLTHGFDGGVYANDGSILRIEEMKDVFEQSLYLFDKPKLFFIQACQGDVDGRGFMLQRDSPIAEDHLCDEVTQSITTDADFLFFMATTPGKISWRSVDDGTWFIQTLCRVLQEKASYWSLLDMLLQVNNKIASMTEINPEGGDAKQMSDFHKLTLRKKLYFHPSGPFSRTVETPHDRHKEKQNL